MSVTKKYFQSLKKSLNFELQLAQNLRKIWDLKVNQILKLSKVLQHSHKNISEGAHFNLKLQVKVYKLPLRIRSHMFSRKIFAIFFKHLFYRTTLVAAFVK